MKYDLSYIEAEIENIIAISEYHIDCNEDEIKEMAKVIESDVLGTLSTYECDVNDSDFAETVYYSLHDKYRLIGNKYELKEETTEQTFEELKEQTKGLTCLLCNQGFDETKRDCLADNNYDNDSFGQRCLKENILFRLLDENLDYGKFNETESELTDDNLHSERLEQRCSICEKVSKAWVDGKVKDFKHAQELADVIAGSL